MRCMVGYCLSHLRKGHDGAGFIWIECRRVNRRTRVILQIARKSFRLGFQKMYSIWRCVALNLLAMAG